jgi:hypothetical protein
LLRTTDQENINQHQSGDETANMRAVSNTALLGTGAEVTQAINQLENKPQPNGYEGRHLRDKVRQQYGYATRGKQQDVATQNT